MLLCQGRDIQGIIGQEECLAQCRVALAEHSSLQILDQATTTQLRISLIATRAHGHSKTLFVRVPVDIDTSKFLNCIQQTYTLPWRRQIYLCSLVDATLLPFSFLGNIANHLLDKS